MLWMPARSSDLQATSRLWSISCECIPLGISLKIDVTAHTVAIEDTGDGMTHDELVQHFGTIVKSRSLEFLQNAS